MLIKRNKKTSNPAIKKEARSEYESRRNESRAEPQDWEQYYGTNYKKYALVSDQMIKDWKQCSKDIRQEVKSVLSNTGYAGKDLFGNPDNLNVIANKLLEKCNRFDEAFTNNVNDSFWDLENDYDISRANKIADGYDYIAKNLGFFALDMVDFENATHKFFNEKISMTFDLHDDTNMFEVLKDDINRICDDIDMLNDDEEENVVFRKAFQSLAVVIDDLVDYDNAAISDTNDCNIRRVIRSAKRFTGIVVPESNRKGRRMKREAHYYYKKRDGYVEIIDRDREELPSRLSRDAKRVWDRASADMQDMMWDDLLDAYDNELPDIEEINDFILDYHANYSD